MLSAVHPYAFQADLEALVLVPLLAVGYVLTLRRYPASRARIACFAGGLALILAAFATPLQSLALRYLLTAHLLQNVVLAEWAPALLLLGLAPALAARLGRLRPVSILTLPFVALPLWLVTTFSWHVPWAYDGALHRPDWLLPVEHLCYLVAGLALWWPVLHDSPRRLSDGARAAYLFAAFLLASPLGLLLALLPSSLYTVYQHAPRRIWGLSPLADQQIAGLTMAAEQAIVFFAACAFFFARFLKAEEAGEPS
jgi:cytochrome c oxidase assembly factor CtaG